jgi:hypothetical protein
LRTSWDEILEIADDSTNDWIVRERPDGKKYRVFNPESVRRSKLQIAAELSPNVGDGRDQESITFLASTAGVTFIRGDTCSGCTAKVCKRG